MGSPSRGLAKAGLWALQRVGPRLLRHVFPRCAVVCPCVGWLMAFGLWHECENFRNWSLMGAWDACAGFVGPGQLHWERPLVSVIVVACGGLDGVPIIWQFVAFHEACPGAAAHGLGPAG